MALTLLVASVLALAAGVGIAGAEGSVVGPGESIQKAINAAHPGDTIIVRGVHKEDVIIRKDGIKLRGVDDAVIEAPARAGSPCSKDFGLEAICVWSDFNINTGNLTGPRVKDVSVSGFTIRGFETAGPDGNAFVIDFYGTRNATITGNRIMGNVAGAVAIGKSIDATFANNEVVGDPRNTTNALDVEAGSRDTKFANNVVRGYNQGIAVDGTETIDTIIEGNDVIDSTALGIGAADTTGTEIRSNVVSRSGFTGIFMGGQKSQDSKIVGNKISGSGEGIFITDIHGGSVLGNTVRDNCAGMLFEAFEPVGDFKVAGNTVEDNTRSCRAEKFGRNFSGIGIALLGASGMEVTGNHLSGNVPSGPTRISGGVVVATDPYFGVTAKPRDNSVTGNTFGRNKPDIYWDKSGSGNSFVGNNCNMSVPTSLCN